MKNHYLQKADENLPKLITTEIKPDVTADVLDIPGFAEQEKHTEKNNGKPI